MKRKLFSSLVLWVIIAAMVAINSTPLGADDLAGKKASLWRENSSFIRMYTDPRACGINDIVTIRISESSAASNKAALTTSKKTSMSMGIDSFLGYEKEFAGKLNNSFDPKSMFGGSTNNSNQGQGETTQASTLTSYITARVIDVMPNGNLVIEAKKEVLVNKEKQTAILSGIIRPRDIAYNNIIESNRVADMQIKFSGKGPVSEQTRRGWLSWLLNTIWPF
jgi:flagellar L-ring protein precursor FlgH